MATRSTPKAPQEADDQVPARRRILDAAFAAFIERGFAETSTLEIATRARNSTGVETSRAALREIMTRARSAGLLGGEIAEMADQFAGLLWGNLMTGLLLRVAERPSSREIARRADAATAALLQLYGNHT